MGSTGGGSQISTALLFFDVGNTSVASADAGEQARSTLSSIKTSSVTGNHTGPWRLAGRHAHADVLPARHRCSLPLLVRMREVCVYHHAEAR